MLLNIFSQDVILGGVSMIFNCGEEFNEFHVKRFSKMTPEELIAEYDAVCTVLDLDNVNCLYCLDDLLAWEVLISERCVEIVRATLEPGTPQG